MKIKHTPFYLIAFLLCYFQACNGQQAKKNASTNNTPKAATTAQKTTSKSGRFSTGNAMFKINGVQAYRAFDRADNPIAQLNAVNDNLTISMHGDVKDGVLQGMLSLRKIPFNKTTGVVTGATISFIRYVDDKGGKSIGYTNRNASFNLTKCEKKTNGAVGEEWLLSGTFSATLKVNSYDEPLVTQYNTDKEITISDGTFENLTMVVLGKKP